MVRTCHVSAVVGGVSALLLGASLAVAAEPVADASELASQSWPALEWSWDAQERHRWYFETEVQLPSHMWFNSFSNKEVRVSAFQVKMMVSCGDAEEVNKKTWDVHCTVEDIGLRAAALPADQGRLAPILAEWDERLTGMSFDLVQKRTGRVVNMGLDETGRNRRDNEIHQNYRLVLMRLLAGLDFQLPRSGVLSGGWPQYESQLIAVPSVTGSAGALEIIYHPVQVTEEEQVVVRAAGKGLIVPPDAMNQYDARYEGVLVFDASMGMLTEHQWTMIADPTASSIASEGADGIPYGQRGLLRYLPPGHLVSVGETEETHAPGQQPTTLQQWTPLGYVPTSYRRTAPAPLGSPASGAPGLPDLSR